MDDLQLCVLKTLQLIKKAARATSNEQSARALEQISTLSLQTAQKIRDYDQKQLQLGDNQLQINFNKEVKNR